MFAQLNTFLNLDGTKEDCAGVSKCIVVIDQERHAIPIPRPPSTFLELHFLAHYLKLDHPCCFYSILNTIHHFKVIAGKCAFGMQTYLDSQQLKFSTLIKSVDSDQSLDPQLQCLNPERRESLREIFVTIRMDLCAARSVKVGKPTCIFLSDIGVLLDLGFDVRDIIALIRSLHSLVSDGVIVLCTSLFEEEESESLLKSFLCQYGDLTLIASGLRSGISATIDGELAIQSVDADCLLKPPKRLHYKVQDRRVQFFAPGTTSGML